MLFFPLTVLLVKNSQRKQSTMISWADKKNYDVNATLKAKVLAEARHLLI